MPKGVHDETYNTPGFLIIFDINFFIKGVELIVFSPQLGVFELSKSILGNKLPRTKISPTRHSETEGKTYIKYIH